MYTKKLLSAAAAMAVFSSGAMAFDAWHFDKNDTGYVGARGVIVAERDNDTVLFSSYTDGNMSNTNITKLGSNAKGDALIYPAFNQTGDWGTEIIVRNTSDKAIVAKAVIYDGKDSREVKDFNIYLSPYDVSRFTIKDGRIKSNDGSIKTYGINPHQAYKENNDSLSSKIQSDTQDNTDYAVIKFANEKPFDEELKVETGYVIIYGMEQVDRCIKEVGLSGKSSEIANGLGCFHNDHAGLYAAYAASLDSARPGWRELTASNGNMFKGMFYDQANQPRVTQAPDVNSSDTVISYQWYEDDTKIVKHTTTFGDVANILTGTVRVYNPAGRDMLLNATAISKFTANRRILWTEGEYASLGDRCITDGNKTAGLHAYYDATCIEHDAKEFSQSNAVYTFANAQGDIKANKLLVTQPYKRILAQLNAEGIILGDKHKTKTKNLMSNFSYTGSNNFVDTADDGLEKVDTGTGFKFVVNQFIYDEDEHKNAEAIGGTIITSPRTSDNSGVSFNKEVQEVNSDQLEKASDLKGAYDKTNGFVRFDLKNKNKPYAIPAITTQMVGSVVGSSAETNWVYTSSMSSN